MSPTPKPTLVRTSANQQKPLASSTNAQTSKNAADSAPKKKKQKVDTAEKKAKLEAEAAKKAQLAQEREQKKREKAEAEEKKKREKEEAAKEREQKKREKEEADRLKAEQKAEREAERKQRAEEKEKKKREKDEEEAKKARSQKKLTDLFKMGTPKKESLAPISQKDSEENASTTPVKAAAPEASVYRTMFKPFYVKENVTLATTFSMDEETREAKSRILQEYVEGKREEVPLGPFIPLEMLQLPFPIRRGKIHPSVRKIMEAFNEEPSSKMIDLTTDSKNSQVRHTQEALNSIPIKSLKFREDVRPPYIGTVTGPLPKGIKSLRQLARNPVRKDVLPLNYDYDSEAEWQEEDGEDVEDLDDEEDELDMDEDKEMSDFLDDEDDQGPSRLVFSGGMEPESTGIQWEDSKYHTSLPDAHNYRLEFILGKSFRQSCSVQANSLTHCNRRHRLPYWNRPLLERVLGPIAETRPR